MLSSKLQDAFNKQINAELYSSYLYLSMAAYFEDERSQGHGPLDGHPGRRGESPRDADLRFRQRPQRPGDLDPIDAPKAEWKSPLEAFEDAYKHEKKITGMINELFKLVAVEKDGAGHDFLEWFCREQVEEEANAQLIVAQLKLVGDNGVGLYLLDQELGKRGAE